MILIDKGVPTSCLNWNFICKDKFPSEYNDSNVKEDFELLFQENFDQIKLKEVLRTSTREPNQAARKFLWKRILINDTSQGKITMEKYTEKISVLFGKNLQLKASLPDFVDQEHLTFYYLNDNGKEAVSRLLNVLESFHPDITFAPLLVPLASLFLHYMNEQECFACLLSVVESKNKITQTDIHWITTNHVFRRFAQKYSHNSYEYLLEALYKQTNDPDSCFDVIDNWQWWIFEYLPFNFVLNIVDSFLLEGQKVLYRYGIAILDLFYKSNPNRQHTLKTDCIMEFCNHIQIPFDRILKTAFGYRNMSRKDIEGVFQAEEKVIKKLRATSNTNNKPHIENDYKKKVISLLMGPFAKTQLIEDLDEATRERKMSIISKSSPSTSSLMAKSTQQNSKNPLRILKLAGNKKWYMNSSSTSSHSFYHHHHPQSNLNLPSFSVEKIGSSILTHEQIATLWRWLPSRYQILELQLIYSTNIHGCRLMTLFDKIEYYPSTIIVVKTTTNSIFGAYCSTPWSNRISQERTFRPRFFGNGETFLFELYPNTEKYEWTGKSSKGKTTINQELFQYADSDKLVVGGGTDKGVGLLINSDLIYGRTGESDTFDNKLLGTESDFEIAILEVFSFKSLEC